VHQACRTEMTLAAALSTDCRRCRTYTGMPVKDALLTAIPLNVCLILTVQVKLPVSLLLMVAANAERFNFDEVQQSSPQSSSQRK